METIEDTFWNYPSLKDYADPRSLELIMDKSWSFEVGLHKPKKEAEAAAKEFCKNENI